MHRQQQRRQRTNMPDAADSGGSWQKLIKQKRRTAVYRITLLVRGKQIIKEYRNEDDYRKWKEAYEYQAKRKQSGVESVRGAVVYR